MRARRAALILLMVATGACTTILPDNKIYLTPTQTVPVASLVTVGMALGAAYYVLDPLAPNWEIKEEPLTDNRVRLALKMKRYYAGGAGEARVVFQRRARDLARYGEFDGYEVIDYNEGMESSVLGSQRVCEGVIRLTPRLAVRDYGAAPPARMTPARATKPLS